MAFNKRTVLVAVVAVGLAIVLVAGVGFRGRRETVASRSAAALREALRKGEPVGASAHGGHGGSQTTNSDMSGHGMSPSGASGRGNAMPGMSMPGMATSGHAGMQPGMAGMQHGTTGTQPGMPGMQHGMTGMPTAGKPQGSMSSGTSTVALPKAAEALPGQPAGTLRPDSLDQPAETSVLDATHAQEMASEMGGMAGMEHGGTSYRQLDAGRDSATAMPGGESIPPESSVTPRTGAPSSHHHGMQHGLPQPAPTPVPRQKPPSSERKPSTPPIAPTHPPHHHSGGEDRP
jgi:hypothetical protein